MGWPLSLTVVQTAVRAVISGPAAVAVEEAVMEDSVLSKTPAGNAAGMAEVVPKSKSHVAAESEGMVANIICAETWAVVRTKSSFAAIGCMGTLGGPVTMG